MRPGSRLSIFSDDFRFDRRVREKPKIVILFMVLVVKIRLFDTKTESD